jgi:putative Holliday junction resolvase
MPDVAPPRGGAVRTADASALGEGVVLGFDFGARRLGVAVGNGVTRQARPLAVIADVGDVRWRRVGELIAAWQPVALVVGVPRHSDGAPHAMTERCERFARQLEGRFRLPVARVDERFSSAVVPGGRDDEAAAVILQQWLWTDRRQAPDHLLSPSRGGDEVLAPDSRADEKPIPARALEGAGDSSRASRRAKGS